MLIFIPLVFSRTTDTGLVHRVVCLFTAYSFCQYSLHLPMEGWPGWVDLGGWLHTEIVYPPADGHPCTNWIRHWLTLLMLPAKSSHHRHRETEICVIVSQGRCKWCVSFQLRKPKVWGHWTSDFSRKWQRVLVKCLLVVAGSCTLGAWFQLWLLTGISAVGEYDYNRQLVHSQSTKLHMWALCLLIKKVLR